MIHRYDNPVICSQVMGMGSEKINFIKPTLTDHGIDGFVVRPMDEIDDHYDLYHDYGKNDTSIEICDSIGDLIVDTTDQTRSPGIILIVETEGATIDLFSSDPPYNVKVEPRSNTAIAAGLSSFGDKKAQLHHQSFDKARGATDGKKAKQKMRAKDRPLANDFVSDEDFDNMLLAWFANASRVMKPGASFYIWGGYANLGNYPAPIKAAGLYFSQGVIWDKQHPVLTRKDFMGAFEICFYGWKEGAGHHFYGPNNATDLWHVKKVNPQAMVHLTEKPDELAVRCIQYSSKPGENVLDLFGGSGSTLMGCEQTDRHAYLMELDTLYCDVIVKRWEEFTGKEAQRIAGTDKTPTNAGVKGKVMA